MKVLARTIHMMNSTGASTVSWSPPGRIAIIKASLALAAASATGGLDGGGVFLTTISGTTVNADTAGENILLYLPFLALVNGTVGHYTIVTDCYREVAPGQLVGLSIDAVASGAVSGSATFTFLPL